MNAVAQSETISMSLLDAIGDAFNRNDLAAVMAFFAEDSIFDHGIGPNIEGQRFEGKAAITAVFGKLFDSVEFVRWDTEDARICGDKAYMEFRRTARLKTGEEQDYLAIDILTIRDGLITHKNTYFKHRVAST